MTDNNAWESILEGNLQSAWDLECEVPTETFVLSSPRTEQLVKFVAKTVQHWGGGLQYINFAYDSGAKIQGKLNGLKQKETCV